MMASGLTSRFEKILSPDWVGRHVKPQSQVVSFLAGREETTVDKSHPGAAGEGYSEARDIDLLLSRNTVNVEQSGSGDT